MNNGYDKIRKKWDIDGSEKVHGDRKDNRAFQRRKFRQSLNNLVGNVSHEEIDEFDVDEQ